MINFKRKRRAYLMPILRGIRKTLNIFKRYAAPTYVKNKSMVKKFY